MSAATSGVGIEKASSNRAGVRGSPGPKKPPRPRALAHVRSEFTTSPRYPETTSAASKCQADCCLDGTPSPNYLILTFPAGTRENELPSKRVSGLGATAPPLESE